MPQSHVVSLMITDVQQDHHSGTTVAAFGAQEKRKKNCWSLALEQNGSSGKLPNLPMASTPLCPSITLNMIKFVVLLGPHVKSFCKPLNILAKAPLDIKLLVAEMLQLYLFSFPSSPSLRLAVVVLRL